MSRRVILIGVVLFALMAWFPATGAAQVSAAIAGVVTDTSGAVLPGVTVEASSPALIEKVRTTITDNRGLYQIVDLRGGVYSVTFALPGFATVKREGIDLAAGFTATINAQLRVGTIEESVTVTAENPVVDVRNVVHHNVMTQQLIQELPTGKILQSLAVLIPGVSIAVSIGSPGGVGQDVGGSQGARNTSRIVVHGTYEHDVPLIYDGMRYGFINNEVARTQFQFNPNSVQEVTMEAGLLTAESETSGIWTNIIPKAGANSFSGLLSTDFANKSMRSKNVSAAQVSAGTRAQSATDKIFDFNPSFGGPIKPDKLWFNASYRYFGVDELQAGAFHDTNPLDFVFTPDQSRPVVSPFRGHIGSVHLTWQAATKHKVSLHGDYQRGCRCGENASATVPYEATTRQLKKPELYQATWNWTASNRLLVEAGYNMFPSGLEYVRQPDVGRDVYSVRDGSTGISFRAPAGTSSLWGPQRSTKTNLTFVTGSHQLRAGLQTMWGTRQWRTEQNNDAILNIVTVPTLQAVSVTVRNTPFEVEQKLKMSMGLWAQDQWTMKRLTLHLGGRFDYLNAYVPAHEYPAVRYVGARSFPRLEGLPIWKDFSPRLGAAWDLFGDARTAVKVSLGRYVEGITTAIANAADPANASVTQATRAWVDINNDFIPQDNELGPPNPSTFGQSIVRTRFDPEFLKGWGKRWNNWESSVSIQRELRPGISVSAGYFRRWFGNFRVTDNLDVTPANWDEYCITAPTDPRLSAGANSGQQICGLYDITPTLFGRQNNLISLGENFGKKTQVYDGVDLSATVRLPQGGTVQGGMNVGRTRTSTCFVVDSPGEMRFCDINPPFQPQVKLLGTYPLPWWDLMLSGTFQSLPSTDIQANWTVSTTAIAPSLGRPLAGGTRTVVVPLIQPGSVWGDRLNQIDFRVAKRFRAGRVGLKSQFDLYNMLNANPVLAQNNTYGPNWLQPVNILPGRLFKVGLEVTF